jgi:outer membrane beta-barrel protein
MMNKKTTARKNRSQPFLIKLISATLIASPSISLAQENVGNGATKPVADSNRDKLDVSNLEAKYWSAKDDDFTVVQNRTYTKNRRLFINMSMGRLINDGFVEGTPNSFGIGYFFNEKNGFALDYTQFVTKDNQVVEKSKTDLGAPPAYNSPVSTASISYIWSPIYAKVSLLEKKILYLDLSVALRLGMSEYKMMTTNGGEKKQTPHYGIDVSQLWFINKAFAFRFDIRNSWSSQNQMKYKLDFGADESTRPLGATVLQDTTWMFGVNFFFGRK